MQTKFWCEFHCDEFVHRTSSAPVEHHRVRISIELSNVFSICHWSATISASSTVLMFSEWRPQAMCSIREVPLFEGFFSRMHILHRGWHLTRSVSISRCYQKRNIASSPNITLTCFYLHVAIPINSRMHRKDPPFLCRNEEPSQGHWKDQCFPLRPSCRCFCWTS